MQAKSDELITHVGLISFTVKLTT